MPIAVCSPAFWELIFNCIRSILMKILQVILLIWITADWLVQMSQYQTQVIYLAKFILKFGILSQKRIHCWETSGNDCSWRRNLKIEEKYRRVFGTQETLITAPDVKSVGKIILYESFNMDKICSKMLPSI